MTIKEIANSLGVSTATVSNVIHGHLEKMSPETAQMIRKKLEEYEAKLGLVRRYLAITAEAGACLQALDADDRAGARRHLQNILQIER